MLFGIESRSRHTPSIRYRTRIRSPKGSMWISDARDRTASVISRLISRTIGALASSSPDPPDTPSWSIDASTEASIECRSSSTVLSILSPLDARNLSI